MLCHDTKSNYCSKCNAWKGQLGLEPTPELYIEHLTEIFSEVKRVLKNEGTLWLNIGDTYSTVSGRQGKGDLYGKQPKYSKEADDSMPQKIKINNLQSKCLCMIPERLAWSLIQDGWILRNKIIWYKPNAMPSSVTDRFSNKYEFIYLFAKQQEYYFDLDAVRGSFAESTLNDIRIGCKTGRPGKKAHELIKKGIHGSGGIGDPNKTRAEIHNPLGKNPGDVFTINTQPFPEAHFAVFPGDLVEKPIKAGCPEEVCKKCGKARERIVEKMDTGMTQKMPDYWDSEKGSHGRIHRKGREKGETGIPITTNKTIGWTFCSCNAGFEPGIVLDPFAGAGTTLLVAKEMKRRYIGIEINKEYIEITNKRLAQGVL